MSEKIKMPLSYKSCETYEMEYDGGFKLDEKKTALLLAATVGLLGGGVIGGMIGHTVGGAAGMTTFGSVCGTLIGAGVGGSAAILVADREYGNGLRNGPKAEPKVCYDEL